MKSLVAPHLEEEEEDNKKKREFYFRINMKLKQVTKSLKLKCVSTSIKP